MKEGTIEIRIDEKGDLRIETHNILGPACIEEVEKILKEIASITDVQKTDEFYMKPQKVTVQSKALQEVRG